MGDGIATASVPSNGTSGPPIGANEDPLSQIFGGGAPASTGPAPSAPASKQRAIDDILGLFGPNGGADAQPTSPVPAPSMASPFGQTAAPAPAPTALATARPPAPQQTQGYAAYEKNGLQITLRPQVYAARPGLVLVTARLEATGLAAITKINFQVAVPKACLSLNIKRKVADARPPF